MSCSFGWMLILTNRTKIAKIRCYSCEIVIDDVYIFTQPDECIDFLTEMNDMKIFLIIADILGQQILPLIHDIPQLDGVYIFCRNKTSHHQWATTWVKVKGIHTEITHICESLQQIVKQIVRVMSLVDITYRYIYNSFSSSLFSPLRDMYLKPCIRLK